MLLLLLLLELFIMCINWIMVILLLHRMLSVRRQIVERVCIISASISTLLLLHCISFNERNIIVITTNTVMQKNDGQQERPFFANYCYHYGASS